MTPLCLQVFIEPVIYRREVKEPPGIRTDLAGLCRVARVTLRATVPYRPILVYSGSAQIRTPSIDIVGVPVADLESEEAALRALEALAHSFFDHAARACVCRKGMFFPPK